MGKSKFQRFIENFVYSALTMLKVILLSKWVSKNKNAVKKFDECVILGNGPSLEQSLKNSSEFLSNRDVFVVNFFWKSEYFAKIKPRFYIILSTNYWTSKNSGLQGKDRKNTFKEIAMKTNWEMCLFVPAKARGYNDWKQDLIGNKFVKIVYFNITPTDGGFKLFNHFLYHQRLALPRPHNVLVPSIKFAIDLNYRNVFILGADHSWLKEIYVTDDNVVLLTQKHFYDYKSAKPETMHKGIDSPNNNRNMAEILTKFVHAFNSYYVLQGYANSRGVNILNATDGSFIDAFERYRIV